MSGRPSKPSNVRRRAARAHLRAAWKPKGRQQSARSARARQIDGAKRPKPPNVSMRVGTHRDQHIDRLRVAVEAKTRTRRRKSIARASDDRNVVHADCAEDAE